MKRFLLFLFSATSLCAQWIVNDPINTLVNTTIQSGQVANHVEILRQWAQQLENLNRQLVELKSQLSVQERIRDVIGDPAAAGGRLALESVGASDLLRQYGETRAAAQRLASAIDSLRRTSEGIYGSLEDETTLGQGFERKENLYRRFAAVERQADNEAQVRTQTDERLHAVQTEIADTLVLLRGAGTQAEVDKYTAKLGALNGQVAHLDAQRREEMDKLRTQALLNENQAAKERQDFLEKQLAEERQTSAAVEAWETKVVLTPTDYTHP